MKEIIVSKSLKLIIKRYKFDVNDRVQLLTFLSARVFILNCTITNYMYDMNDTEQKRRGNRPQTPVLNLKCISM